MNLMCPVSFRQINENTVRINAALAAASIFIFLCTSWKWIILLVAADFFIRGFLNPCYSFFTHISKKIVQLFQLTPIMVDAAPKIFAAKIGFLFCCILTVSWLLNIRQLDLIAGSIFMVCAGLETVFKFCVACKLYPFIYKFQVIR